jgi:hypothetical protein
MEQQFDATYLRPGIVERAVAVGIAAAGVGTGVLLAAWGVSLLWRYVPPEIAVRVANPELRVVQEAPFKVEQDRPFKVEQDKPFVLAQPEPLKINPAKPTSKGDQPSPSIVDENDTSAKTASGDVIRRGVTVFWNVNHGPGNVTTGWNYKDGTGGVPVRQYCYYGLLNGDRSMTKVDIASDGTRLPQISASLVPDLEGALAKCQWWQPELSDLR